jgi:hypothetical protein
MRGVRRITYIVPLGNAPGGGRGMSRRATNATAVVAGLMLGLPSFAAVHSTAEVQRPSLAQLEARREVLGARLQRTPSSWAYGVASRCSEPTLGNLKLGWFF